MVGGLDVAPRVEIETKRGRKTFMNWRDKAHREKHEIGLDLKFAAGYGLQFLVRAHTVQGLDPAILVTLDLGRHDAEIAFGPLCLNSMTS